MKRRLVSLVAMLLFLSVAGYSQVTESTNGGDNVLNVFLDGNFIDENFLREEFPYVNYVRTRESSDVHVLGTRTMTGAGAQYDFYFMGLKQYAGKTDTLKYFSPGQATQTEARTGYSNVLKMGLIRYMAISNHIVDISVSSGAPRTNNIAQEDPWDSWVFELDLGGNFSAVESRKTQTYNAGIDISRVTPDWRHEFEFNYRYGANEFKSGDYYSKSETVDAGFDFMTVKSLGPKSGVGLLGHVERNTVNNYDLYLRLAAAAEYNFFPYDMSSRRQFTAGYYLGVDARNYFEMTVWEKTEEVIVYEMFSLGYSQREQWGNVYGSVTFSNFMRNFSENNLNINGGLNIRIWKGLSWNLSGSFAIINDDVNISIEDVRPEDLLLGLRQLATSQSFRLNTGFSFQFGSMYNNVVNTRLRGITGGGGGNMGGGGPR